MTEAEALEMATGQVSAALARLQSPRRGGSRSTGNRLRWVRLDFRTAVGGDRLGSTPQQRRERSPEVWPVQALAVVHDAAHLPMGQPAG